MTEEHTAMDNEGNPGQPPGYLVAPDPGADETVELNAIEEEKRRDTLAWEEANNPPANTEMENPANPEGWARPVARVFLPEGAIGVVGSRVLLATEDDRLLGKVAVEREDDFDVRWDDGRETTEEKQHYELVEPMVEDGE